jgi:inorganic phosphate transporter, PiT family
MSLALLIFVAVAGLYVGANIGANDAANCIGPSVGAGLIRYRTAIIAVAACVVLGALLQGGEVMKTVGKGIVTDPIEPLGVAVALFSGGLFVSLATFYKIPVSTSQSVVGAVAGVGVASSLNVDWSKLLTIAECWVLCPILSMVLTYVIYRGALTAMDKAKNQKLVRRTLTWLVVVSSAYAAYSLGANNLGNAIGPISSLGGNQFNMKWLSVAGAVSMAVGALVFGRGVAETVGKSIIKLDLPGAFSVQVSAAIGLHVFSMMGIPVSTSQAVVGGLLGVGLLRGINTVSRRKMAEVVIGWVATPAVGGVTSFSLYWLALRIF